MIGGERIFVLREWHPLLCRVLWCRPPEIRVDSSPVAQTWQGRGHTQAGRHSERGSGNRERASEENKEMLFRSHVYFLVTRGEPNKGDSHLSMITTSVPHLLATFIAISIVSAMRARLFKLSNGHLVGITLPWKNFTQNPNAQCPSIGTAWLGRPAHTGTQEVRQVGCGRHCLRVGFEPKAQ